MTAGFFPEKIGDGVDKGLAGAGEELDVLFAGLVAAQKSILLVIATVFNGFSQNIGQSIDQTVAAAFQNFPAALTAVDITDQNIPGII